MDETYLKSSIVQYGTMPEYIAMWEQHYDMSRVDTATRNKVEMDVLSIQNEHYFYALQGTCMHVTSIE